jgi:hypothetical protein
MSATRISRPTVTEEFDDLGAVVGAPAFYGPPVSFILGPWLLIGLLLAPPAAVLITLLLVAAVAAALLIALVAVVVSPYLLVRRVYAQWSAHRREAQKREVAAVRRAAHPAPAASELTGPRGWRPVKQPAGAHLVHMAAK